MIFNYVTENKRIFLFGLIIIASYSDPPWIQSRTIWPCTNNTCRGQQRVFHIPSKFKFRQNSLLSAI